MNNSASTPKERFFRAFKNVAKPIVGMVHLRGQGREAVLAEAKREIEIYFESGVDAALAENYFGDAVDVENALAWLHKNCADRAYGVNLLDKEGDFRKCCRDAFAMARAYGASFVQIDSVCGHLPPRADVELADFLESVRKEYADVLLFGGVRFKYHPVLSGRPVEKDLQLGKERCDAVVATGVGTGVETDYYKLLSFRKSLGDFPLVVGAGMTAENCKDQLSIADGAIVGSFFKEDGRAENPVSPSRAREFMSVVKGLREE